MAATDEWEDLGAAAAHSDTTVQEAHQDPTSEEPERPPTPPASLAPPLLQQLDVIVLDVSHSMKSRSGIDPDQTREDVSKIMFHTFVDKMVCLEMDHAVGLVSFGSEISLAQPMTTSYEKFHDELGRLDASQRRTRLFDAIVYAVDVLLHFSKANKDGIARGAPLRVFALTDGEDNASVTTPAALAQRLQMDHVVLDVFPLACVNRDLRAVCFASGGSVVDVTGVQQGISAFEEETLLHVPSRLESAAPAQLRCAADFEAMAKSVESPRKEAPPSAAPTGSTPVAAVTATSWSKVATNTGVVSRDAAMGLLQTALTQCKKRLVKELNDFQRIDDIRVHVCAGEGTTWKIVLSGPRETVYEGGTFVLLFEFPSDYPFKPPRVRFLTPVYHPNINSSGAICLDILKSSWSPSLTSISVARCLSSLLCDPNPADPLDSVKAQLYRDDRDTYMRNARSSVETHAMPMNAVLAAAGIDAS